MISIKEKIRKSKAKNAICVISEIHKVGIKRVPYENCFVQRENEYV